MKLREIDSLAECYRVEASPVLISGIEALVRLLLLQSHRDRQAGLDTAGFVSGYRGSPLGGLDQALWRCSSALDAARIRFEPGLNEELAATSIWGAQQANLLGDGRFDGVFGLWYGKGPGVDRAVDALKHGNFAGTAPNGGVLVVAGDDHACKSSTLVQQSELSLMSVAMPVLSPIDVADILELGLLGYGLSRFTGCWAGLIVTQETADAVQSVSFAHEALEIVEPQTELPSDGVHIRWPDTPLAQERRLHEHKLRAALDFARANNLDRIVWDSPRPRIGLVTTGKAHGDLMQALDLLGIDAARAEDLGVRILNVRMVWPLEPQVIAGFASGLEEVVVIEEKRAVVEPQIKEQLFARPPGARPIVVGKHDDEGAPLLTAIGEFSASLVAAAVAKRLARLDRSGDISERAARLAAEEAERTAWLDDGPSRMPHFCSGCPHNTSTVVPDGSRAVAGIGCHFMAIWMGRSTATFTQMGGEGAAWIGQAPFVNTEHIFQNIGDGTYTHSGLLAIRAAVAAGVTITYKILFNHAVAMTGSQPVEGGFSPAQIARQLVAEGVGAIAIITDHPDNYSSVTGLPPSVSVHGREAFEAVQRRLREHKGVTALIYDQACAAETRRKRSRGLEATPDERVIVNDLVCEGCGDCSEQSNCLSVLPLETELGRKRTIDQSACNRDFSCLDGFCPSFVTLRGATPRCPAVEIPDALPEPPVASRDGPWNVVVAGIGGTGVVTLGRLLGLAAHLDGKAVLELAQTGLAQKFGAVLCHVRVAESNSELDGARVAEGCADVLLGCDLMVAAGSAALSRLARDRSALVVNSHDALPPDFIHERDLELPAQALLATLKGASKQSCFTAVDATACAADLLGDAMLANVFMLGNALQRGLLPVSVAALERALELFGTRLEQNRRALALGRLAALEPERVEAMRLSRKPPQRQCTTLEEIVEYRRGFLTDYQDTAYAQRYVGWISRIRDAEQAVAGASTVLTETVARNYFKLLAYKDEYEVARLYTETDFLARLSEEYEGNFTLSVHLAPPLLRRPDEVSGRPLKRKFGAWMLSLMRVLARLRFLRGSRWDVFGYAQERRTERRLIADYEALLEKLIAELDSTRLPLAIDLAGIPRDIRGFGPVKALAVDRAERKRAELLAAWESSGRTGGPWSKARRRLPLRSRNEYNGRRTVGP